MNRGGKQAPGREKGASMTNARSAVAAATWGREGRVSPAAVRLVLLLAAAGHRASTSCSAATRTAPRPARRRLRRAARPVRQRRAAVRRCLRLALLREVRRRLSLPEALPADRAGHADHVAVPLDDGLSRHLHPYGRAGGAERRLRVVLLRAARRRRHRPLPFCFAGDKQRDTLKPRG